MSLRRLVLAGALLCAACGCQPDAAPVTPPARPAAVQAAALEGPGPSAEEHSPGAALAPASASSSVPASAAGGAFRETTFDDLKFDMEIGSEFDPTLLTPQVESLFGQKIRIRGYILPTLRKRGLKQFVLVRDNMECCFGPGAALYDCILVTMQEGKTAEFTIRPVAVEGVFDFEQHAPLGPTLAIYKMTAESVE
jgi:hypothetical protein